MRIRTFAAAALFAATALGACTGASIDSQVAGAEVALTGAEGAALLYTKLPRCNASTPLCATQPAVDAIKGADNQAYAAVVEARNNTGTIDAALTAINSLSALIPSQPAAAADRGPLPAFGVLHEKLQRS